MGDEIDFVGRNLEHLLQDIGGLPAHDNQAVRQSGNLLHDHSLVCIWFTQNGVQRRYHGHLETPQKFEDMTACRAAKNSVLMLQTDQVDVAKIQEVRRLSIRS